MLWKSITESAETIVVASEFIAEDFSSVDWTTAPWPGEPPPPPPPPIRPPATYQTYRETITVRSGQTVNIKVDFAQWVSLQSPIAIVICVAGAFNATFAGRIYSQPTGGSRVLEAKCGQRSSCAMALGVYEASATLGLSGRVGYASDLPHLDSAGGNSEQAAQAAFGRVPYQRAYTDSTSEIVASTTSSGGNGTVLVFWTQLASAPKGVPIVN